MEIRAATADDITKVLELWRNEAAASPTDDEEGLRALIARDAHALLVATEQGRVIGTVIGAWDGWRGNIYRLAVRDDHRRGGMGSRLVAAAVESMRERGARRIAALVEADNALGQAFWRAQPAFARAEQDRFVLKN